MEDQDSVYSVKNSFHNPVLESESPQVPLCRPSDKLCCSGRGTTEQEYGRGLKSRITQGRRTGNTYLLFYTMQDLGSRK